MNKLLQRYNQLSEREQRLVMVSAVVLLIGMFYWLLWSPLNNALDKSRNTVATQQQLLTWVSKNANKVEQLRRSGSHSQAFHGSLPQAVNQTAEQNKIAIARMQPQGDELQVWVDEASFNAVVNWLQALESMGVVIIKADMAETGKPGMVRIRRLQLGKQ